MRSGIPLRVRCFIEAQAVITPPSLKKGNQDRDKIGLKTRVTKDLK